ncbi:MAG: prolipoprotein diacylglyceryl transferase, partial [Actinobacteria bacterium]|nr:prolipoprotein diacylglyceryl transferase [Actinomycetota bacterium]
AGDRPQPGQRLLGVAGAKVYYLSWHREARRAPLRAGMCIQGFVLAAIAGLVAGSYLTGVDVGAALDVSAAGLMLGMVIGRFGCFFGGCCAGRLTASRWGLWSSDRRLGARRVPTQLLEAGLAAAIGAAAWTAVWVGEPRPAGTVFVAAVAAYTLGRQLLFPLRDVPRQTVHGRMITLIVSAVVFIAALAVVMS